MKVVETGGGRMAISSLRVEGAVNGEVLRAIPLGRIEACANAQLGGWATPPTSGGATETRIRTSGGAAPDGTGGWETPPPGTPDEVGAVRRGRPDSFYASIAREYGALAASSSRPAADLAERHEVPASTAHRWIKEARRRHLLRPGQPGKAG
ncbi:hypothetical protein [Aquihabitans sp. McL0605]|uniref:hypothetical protein n=1 Tax=Aquihabitans sp. McL0605 TaxID=3415671 RepID=UPI003CEA05B3